MVKQINGKPYPAPVKRSIVNQKLVHFFLSAIRSINKSLFISSVFILVVIPCVKAQDEINYAVYANILYRFTKYIDWPDDKKNGDFVIGLVSRHIYFDV